MPKTRIVDIQIDQVDTDIRDAGGPIGYVYIGNRKWKMFRRKYQNSKEISIKRGCCFGGDYGLMSIPRLKRSFSIRMHYKPDKHEYYRYYANAEVLDRVKDYAQEKARQLNMSGFLVVSVGFLKNPVENEEDSMISYTVDVGLYLIPYTNRQMLSHQSFGDVVIWRSK
jgi:hypothetical protein